MPVSLHLDNLLACVGSFNSQATGLGFPYPVLHCVFYVSYVYRGHEEAYAILFLVNAFCLNLCCSYNQDI